MRAAAGSAFTIYMIAGNVVASVRARPRREHAKDVLEADLAVTVDVFGTDRWARPPGVEHGDEVGEIDAPVAVDVGFTPGLAAVRDTVAIAVGRAALSVVCALLVNFYAASLATSSHDVIAWSGAIVLVAFGLGLAINALRRGRLFNRVAGALGGAVLMLFLVALVIEFLRMPSPDRLHLWQRKIAATELASLHQQLHRDVDVVRPGSVVPIWQIVDLECPLRPQDLIDPWGHPYLAERKSDGSVRLLSFGADRAAGGAGADADLTFPLATSSRVSASPPALACTRR